MHRRKEPDFMKQLHKVREKLTKEWNKKTPQGMLESLHESGKWLKIQLRSSTFK